MKSPLDKSIIVGLILLVGVVLGIYKTPTSTPRSGSFAPSGGSTYRLGQSVGTSDSSIKLSSFKEPVSAIPYTMSYLGSSIEYGTLSPQSTISEFISFSGITQNADGSATLTGVIRGLSRTPGGSNCTASTTLAQSHAGQSIFILSDAPCLFNEYAVKQNTQNITGTWTFSSTSRPTYDGQPSSYNALDLVDNQTLLNTAIQGAATSTEVNMGIVQLANTTQVGVSTASSTAGAPLVIPNRVATSTPGTLCSTVWFCIPVGGSNGKIMQSWLDLTQAFTFSASTTMTGGVSIPFSSGFPTYLNGLKFTLGATRAASSTVLMENGSGGLSFNKISRLISSNTNANLYTTANATTTVYTVVIPPNTLDGTTSILKIDSVWRLGSGTSGNCYPSIAFGNGVSTSTVGWENFGNVTDVFAQIESTLYASSTSNEVFFSKGIVEPSNVNNGSFNVGLNASLTTFFATSSVSLTGQTYIAYNIWIPGTANCGLFSHSEQLLTQ